MSATFPVTQENLVDHWAAICEQAWTRGSEFTFQVDSRHYVQYMDAFMEVVKENGSQKQNKVIRDIAAMLFYNACRYGNASHMSFLRNYTARDSEDMLSGAQAAETVCQWYATFAGSPHNSTTLHERKACLDILVAMYGAAAVERGTVEELVRSASRIKHGYDACSTASTATECRTVDENIARLFQHVEAYLM